MAPRLTPVAVLVIGILAGSPAAWAQEADPSVPADAQQSGVQQPEQETGAEGAAREEPEAGAPDDSEPPASTPPRPAGVGSVASPLDQDGEAQDAAVEDEAVPQGPSGPMPAGVGSSGGPVLTIRREGDEVIIGEEQEEEAGPALASPRSGANPTSLVSSRPFQGVFGGAAPVTRAEKHSLSLSGSLFAAYVENVPGDSAPGVEDPRADQESTFGGINGSISYARNWRAATIGAHATGGLGYSPTGSVDPEENGNGERPEWFDRWEAGVNGGFTSRLSRKARLMATAGALYSPYFAFDLFGTLGTGTIASIPVTPGLDYALRRDPALRTEGSLLVDQELTRKSSIEGYAYTAHTAFVSSESDTPDYLDYTVGGRYRYRFSRYIGARAGYAYRSGSYSDVQDPFSSHEIEAGLDANYGRSYQLTRRTTFAFSTGTGFVSGQRVGPGDDEFDPETRLFLLGDASLNHAMGRTWALNTGVRRGLHYVVGFQEPVQLNTAFGSVGGLITPRLDFTADVQYSSGAVGVFADDSGFDTYSGTAGLRYGITRRLAAYAQYFYYHYAFESGVRLPNGLQPQLDRQGATVGLTTWLPLIGSRGRR